MEPLLEVRGLSTRVGRGGQAFLAVDEVSLSISEGRSLGLVGESGCGKTLLALSLVRLLPPAAEIVAGSVRLDGVEVRSLPESELRGLRGRRVGMVFQDTASSFNPVLEVGEQLGEALRAHGVARGREVQARVLEALGSVGLPDPARCAASFPHQLSGGMRQRAMIALALCCGAQLLVADEPTTALDATVQLQLLGLLAQLRAERRLGLLVISHDLGVVSRLCDEVSVMYAGRVVESGPTAEVLRAPRHPYTAALCRAVPPERPATRPRPRLEAIPGRVPAPGERGPGCLFAPRCPRASSECSASRPAMGGGPRPVACWHPLDVTP